MNRQQLENLCEVNGIIHFQLKDKEDLLKVFGIKVDQIKGFDTLSAANKELFTKFLINYYNMLGVDSKLCLQPISIYLVQEIQTFVKLSHDSEVDEIWDWFSTDVSNYNQNTKELKIFKQSKNKYLQYIKDDDMDAWFKNDMKKYLRFDFKWNGKKVIKEWLHVIDAREWY